MMPDKLSKTQRAVLNPMNLGWKVGEQMELGGQTRLWWQKVGAVENREAYPDIHLRVNTINSLERRGLIKRTKGKSEVWEYSRWVLTITDLGRATLEEIANV